MRLFLFLLCTACSWQAFGQVQSFTLPNGLKILVKEDHRAPVAVAMVWYNVGSADEPGGLTGVSHALEHLMFKGTQQFPLGVFSKTIARLGGQENAFTSNDYTAYFETLDVKHLAVSFQMEADRMEHLLLDPDEFSKEIKVIQEERRLRTDDNPQGLSFERFLATAHLASPYHHPVIGWMSDLQQMTVGNARTWYHRFYAPNNATLVVVGDVDPANVFQLAERYFGTLGRRPLSSRKSQLEPPVLGKKSVQIHAPAQMPMIMVGYTVPSVVMAPPQQASDPYVLQVIAGILDGGDSARFSKNILRGRHIASSLDIYYNLYTRYQTQFIIYGTPSPTHTLDQLRQSIQHEIQRLQNQRVTQDELQRIKTLLIAQKTFEKDSLLGQAMALGLLETLGLGWQTEEKYAQRINQVTPEQIQSVAKTYFQPHRLTEAELIPLPAKKGTV